jgi:hypothetical protein
MSSLRSVVFVPRKDVLERIQGFTAGACVPRVPIKGHPPINYLPQQLRLTWCVQLSGF